ncbi:MAG: hypothetical protein SFV17_26335 [Candidatus Obscuribacter sp.]|nr:hypothetical protein [Candidatus Obscuribacter sp.]
MSEYFLEKRQPSTEAIYFAELPPDGIVAALKDREKKFANGRSISASALSMLALESALDQIPKDSSPDESYFLLVPTESNWTAIFESSGKDGADVNTTPAIISRFGHCRVCVAAAARDTSVEHRKDRKIKLSFGSVRFDLLNEGECQRNIQSMNEGTGRWVFYSYGSPLEFENLSAYKNKRVKDRFTVDDLNYVLASNFGIRYKDLTFYRPENGCLLIRERLKIFGLF